MKILISNGLTLCTQIAELESGRQNSDLRTEWAQFKRYPSHLLKSDMLVSSKTGEIFLM
jgi:hypothetical protein